MRFKKYHALGNDYLVMEAHILGKLLTPAVVRRICDRHVGVGADGILVQGHAMPKATLLTHLVPGRHRGGEEWQRPPHYCRALWDTGVVQAAPFPVVTLGGLVTCQVIAQGKVVNVEMGQFRFTSLDIPVTGPPREVLRKRWSSMDRRQGGQLGVEIRPDFTVRMTGPGGEGRRRRAGSNSRRYCSVEGQTGKRNIVSDVGLQFMKRWLRLREGTRGRGRQSTRGDYGIETDRRLGA